MGGLQNENTKQTIVLISIPHSPVSTESNSTTVCESMAD